MMKCETRIRTSPSPLKYFCTHYTVFHSKFALEYGTSVPVSYVLSRGSYQATGTVLAAFVFSLMKYCIMLQKL
jgi:hypothetical protein